ncbi:septum formation family protein [Yinghuangia soli]|uniref:Septum formation family protein n=1 Tax=Yinghuangia soli TaxID=2908204 RepID=A0AA41U442_9ACTN|nr:septum formation family protein [Yinghuangia soli]MCF2530417.1 septum formation family protein [Yinghuangia soli]
MTMPPPPGQGGFPPGYGQQPDPGYQNNPSYPGGYSGNTYPGGPQYPSGPPGGGPQYPGGPTYPGGGYGGPGGTFPGPPGPPPGGGRGPLLLVVVGALVVVGGVIAALVFLLGGDKDKKNEGKNTGTPTAAPTSKASEPSPSATTKSASPTPSRTTRTPSPTPTSTDGLTQVDSTPLAAGDCINLNEITGKIDKVACTTPHDKQVLKNFNLTGSTYPTEAEIERQVVAACQAAFNTATAKEAAPNSFGMYYRVPQQLAFMSGDKEATCLIQNKSDAKLTKKLG